MPTVDFNPEDLFSMYMKVTGVPRLTPVPAPDPGLQGKRLGVVNGSSWITLWSTYFGSTILPGVQLINVGNEGVQLNFMRAHEKGEPCPPQINIDLFVQYAKDIYKLWGMDALIITCSTMNRAADSVKQAMKALGVPVVQIDEPMMEKTVDRGGKTLVVATHGPTVKSTQALLQETASRRNKTIDFTGATVEDAFHQLGEGDVKAHNRTIADAIREVQKTESIDSVVLAQLSMSVFTLSYPDSEAEFGVPVYTSGECGFERVKEILLKS